MNEAAHNLSIVERNNLSNCLMFFFSPPPALVFRKAGTEKAKHFRFIGISHGFFAAASLRQSNSLDREKKDARQSNEMSRDRHTKPPDPKFKFHFIIESSLPMFFFSFNNGEEFFLRSSFDRVRGGQLGWANLKDGFHNAQ